MESPRASAAPPLGDLSPAPEGPESGRAAPPPVSPAPPGGEGAPIGRRVLLGMLGLGAVGVVLGGRIQRGVNAAIAPIQHMDPTGLTSLVPGNEFRIYTVTNGYPKETDGAYRLSVNGLVDHPFTVTLADLRAMPATALVRDFQCVTGWRVPRVHWQGVTLSTLLDRAGVQPAAKALLFESFDGVYTESLTLDQARRPDVIAAYSMLGGPVSTAHGGPVRLYVAPMYGYKSCKWLSTIKVVDRVDPGYWEQNGYDINAWVGASNGRNDKPIA